MAELFTAEQALELANTANDEYRIVTDLIKAKAGEGKYDLLVPNKLLTDENIDLLREGGFYAVRRDIGIEISWAATAEAEEPGDGDNETQQPGDGDNENNTDEGA